MSFSIEPRDDGAAAAPPPATDDAASPPQPPRKRGQALLAWAFILAAVGFILVRAATPRESGGDGSAWLVQLQMQARYLVGVKLVFGTQGTNLYQQVSDQLERGPYGQRLRAAVVAGELAGPDEARGVLRRLENARKQGEVAPASDESVAVARLLDELYSKREAAGKDAALPEAEQRRLREGLGWFGELALAPEAANQEAEGSAQREARRQVEYQARLTMFAMVGGLLLAVLGMGLGAIILVVLLVLAGVGRLGGGLTCGSGGHGGVYAEMFALYIVGFIAINYALRLVPLTGAAGLALGGVAMGLSLAALAWPWLRGVPWGVVRADLGLTLGKEPWKELLAGLGCYLSALPLLAVGLLVMLGLMWLQKQLGLGDASEPGRGPSHPIAGVALAKDPLVWLVVVVLVAVMAPLVEEVMFRGALYRHLREATCRWGRFASVLAAVFFSSFVFAVIHPQGWLGVPVLMALATAFALTREWRGSLVAPMVAHGINNGVVTLVLFLTAG